MYSLFIVAPIEGFCVWSMFYFAVLYVFSSFAIIVVGERADCFTLSVWGLVVIIVLSSS